MTTPSYSFESNADYLQSTALLAPQGDKDVRTNWDYGSTPTSLKNPSSEHFDSQDSSSVTPYTLFKKAKQRSVDNESPSCVQDLEDGFLATDTHKLLSVTKKSLLQRFEEEGKVPVKPEAREKESAEKDPVRWIMLGGKGGRRGFFGSRKRESRKFIGDGDGHLRCCCSDLHFSSKARHAVVLCVGGRVHFACHSIGEDEVV